MLLNYAKLRFRAFLDEIARLSQADFPHSYSKDALEQLRLLFETKLARLEQFSPQSDPVVVKQECSLALRSLFDYLPLLGFVLRSTNVRNAFEMFGPFLRFAGDVLEPTIPQDQRTTRLLLSSEWDYSPFTYPHIPDLPHFLFIGLPAPESGNPLTMPLAGHELGHAVWLAKSYGQSIEPKIKREIVSGITADWTKYTSIVGQNIRPEDLTTNLFAFESWSLAVVWCLRQAEESFCDFLGLRLFRESYLHAFSYVLSPGVGRRAVRYPGIQTRVTNLITAAKSYGVATDANYANLFQPDSAGPLTQADDFRVGLADRALAALIIDLMRMADDIAVSAKVPPPSAAEAQRILGRFRKMVPAEHCCTVVDILNAGWAAFLDPLFWEDLPTVKGRKDEILRELVLKNFEVFEIEKMQQAQ